MEITWIGKSCFLIKTSMGKRILTDPFNCNYINALNDISYITLSHNHFNNNYIPEKLKSSIILRDSYNVNSIDFSIDCIHSFHDEFNGKKRGENKIFIFNFDNYRLAHLGHLGHSLDENQIKILQNINVLLIPIGGNFTINSYTASIICNDINPNIILPMNFNLSTKSSIIDGIDKFIPYMKNVKKLNSDTVILNDFNLYEKQVLLLSPSVFNTQ